MKKIENKKISEVVDTDLNIINTDEVFTSNEVSTNPIKKTAGTHPQTTDDMADEVGTGNWMLQLRRWGRGMYEKYDRKISILEQTMEDVGSDVNTLPKQTIPKKSDLANSFHAPEVELALVNLVRELKKYDKTTDPEELKRLGDIYAIVLNVFVKNMKDGILDQNFKQEIINRLNGK